MNILIAPNAFKNSLTADDAARAIAQGLEQSRLDCQCQRFPVADGGDGTGTLIIKHRNGQPVTVETVDALGREIDAIFGLIDDETTAVIEMAAASGLRILKEDERNPLQATSYGTGLMIKAALDHSVDRIILGMGGSATVDGAMGMLMALGVQFKDADGELISTPAQLTELQSIDITGLDHRLRHCHVTVLCDVDNLLLGDEGAATVFGPQKGASEDDVEVLDQALTRLAEVALKTTGKDMAAVKHGGTAGGAAAGLYALLNAELVSGGAYFLQLTNFEAALQQANLVITGEGSIDRQTLQGKAPFAVASAAKQHQLPVIGLAGAVPLEQDPELSKYFDTLLAIGNEPADLPTALHHTYDNLRRTACELGNLMALSAQQ
ncbi:glycerate kinase [Mucilaginibacter yixingensis]|uniref:Glycerate kinase n=1 Tax=Mucilaginibacter yixingensis TaxID=1295612 RepID=A0A2T5J8J9_9SPHI|nr:glycerate kinase [Mucilaginibacter yixingensis]PTQ95793.1 glycerate kinase [Mucilaginibacter yixingensis]